MNNELFNIINVMNIKSYNLCISGTIGAGKSTIIKILKDNIKNIVSFPEFIEFHKMTSIDLLEMKLNKQIDSITHQSYILDVWRYFIKNYYNPSNFNLFERCIDDSVDIFCRLDRDLRKIMTSEEFDLLSSKRHNINNEYDFISIEKSPLTIIDNDHKSIDEIIHEILKTVIDDQKKSINNRMIYIKISGEESYNRLQHRYDVDKLYSKDELKEYVKYYDEMFNKKSCDII